MSFRFFDAVEHRRRSTGPTAGAAAFSIRLCSAASTATSDLPGRRHLRGRPIVVRFRWSRTTTLAPRWEQAFWDDGGLTWETNWVMELRRLRVTDVRPTARGCRPDYRHLRKVISPGPAVTLGEQAILKWYDVAVADAPVPPPIGVLAREGIGEAWQAGELEIGGLGFAILAPLRSSFYFLLLATWAGDNEIWETVWAKNGSGDAAFRPWPRPGAHVRRSASGARCGLARAAGLGPLPPLGAQPRGRAVLPRGLLPRGRLSRGGPDPGASCVTQRRARLRGAEPCASSSPFRASRAAARDSRASGASGRSVG